MSEEFKPCFVDECGKNSKRRDKYCSMHRARLSRTGRLDKRSVWEKILALSLVDKTTGCMNWQGYLNDSGYGRFRVNGKKTLAHRAAYACMNGEIEEGFLVCHHCDNPACINPEHLFLGTHKDNYDDAVSKGRVDPVTRAKDRWVKCPTLKK